MENNIVHLEHVFKIYGSGNTEVRALDDVTVDFGQAEFTAIMGPSGSGKSTMMHILSGLDTATSGAVFVGGRNISILRDTELTRLRRDQIGFIFQSFNLVPTLDARANIVLPMQLAGRKPDKDWFDLIVTSLGIGDRLGHRPSEMSGGQQQRVAVARALMSRPTVIVADEPTRLPLLRRSPRPAAPRGGRTGAVRHHGHPRHRGRRARRPGPRVPRRAHRRRSARSRPGRPVRRPALTPRSPQ